MPTVSRRPEADTYGVRAQCPCGDRDVLAERLGTTRGALYKTLHDARRKLRTRLADHGLDPDSLQRGEMT